MVSSYISIESDCDLYRTGGQWGHEGVGGGGSWFALRDK